MSITKVTAELARVQAKICARSLKCLSIHVAAPLVGALLESKTAPTNYWTNGSHKGCRYNRMNRDHKGRPCNPGTLTSAGRNTKIYA